MRVTILDRDGVINEDSADFVKSPDEWRPIAGSLEAIARLNQANHRVVVCTNQSGIARGLFGIEELHAMQVKMDQLLAQVGGHVDAVFYCPDGPRGSSNFRKPAPGMLFDIGRRLNIELTGIPMVGDSESDIVAARLAGMSPVLVRTGKGRETERKLDEQPRVPVYDDLATFVDAWLEHD